MGLQFCTYLTKHLFKQLLHLLWPASSVQEVVVRQLPSPPCWSARAGPPGSGWTAGPASVVWVMVEAMELASACEDSLEPCVGEYSAGDFAASMWRTSGVCHASCCWGCMTRLWHCSLSYSRCMCCGVLDM